MSARLLLMVIGIFVSGSQWATSEEWAVDASHKIKMEIDQALQNMGDLDQSFQEAKSDCQRYRDMVAAGLEKGPELRSAVERLVESGEKNIECKTELAKKYLSYSKVLMAAAKAKKDDLVAGSLEALSKQVIHKKELTEKSCCENKRELEKYRELLH